MSPRVATPGAEPTRPGGIGAGAVITIAWCGECRGRFALELDRHETWGEALACLRGQGWRFELERSRVVAATCPQCAQG